MRLPRVVQQLIPDEQRGAERAARIAGSRLNPDVIERPLAQDPPVTHAVQRDAAGQHKFLQSGEAMRLARHPQHRLLGNQLNACGKVHVPLLETRLGIARRSAEQIMKPPARHRQPLAVVEVVHVQPHAAVGLEIDHALANDIGVYRFSVRRETHQFVFAAIHLEAAVVGERRIEQPE